MVNGLIIFLLLCNLHSYSMYYNFLNIGLAVSRYLKVVNKLLLAVCTV